MYYLGHSDIRMTMNLYTQLSKEKERLTGEQFATYIDVWLKNKPVSSDDDDSGSAPPD